MLHAIKNLSSNQTVLCEPWNVETAAPPKDQWARPDLNHCFYSGFEGLISGMRIDKHNPAIRLHWIVADYDGKIDQNMRDTVLERCTDFHPQYICRTFSGGARLLWRLETPFLLHGNDLTTRLMKHVGRKLRVSKIMVGLDTAAFSNPCQYYEAGTDWKQLSSDVIPSAFMMQWAIEATHKHTWRKEGTVIPMDVVAAEVERQYPGRWVGQFDIGARGSRFWDPGADNETAAIVRDSGMQCFTGTLAFVPWSSILGNDFVRKYEADRIGGAIENIWFDGRDYWHQRSNGHWASSNKSDIILALKVNKRLSASVPRNGSFSEVEQALENIHQHQYISCAAPLIHRPEGIVYLNGLRVLNTSTVSAMQPSDKQEIDPGTDFAWLNSYFTSLLDPVEQLDYFYAWLQRWYKSALDQRMLPGQASFFAGVPNTGKTLLSTLILSRIFGGHIDASSFLCGEDNFNSHLFQTAVWAVDDVVPLTNRKSHLKFSALIKKMAANRTFSVREKFKVDKTVEWNGRVVVTCNTDPESIRILPDVDLSNRDKINLFNVADRDDFIFPKDVADIIQTELPHFLRWLLDWTPPAHIVGDTRYGVQTYCEESLFEAARHSSSAYSFLEVLLKFFEGQVDDVWTGSATELLSGMNNDQDGLAGIAAKYTTSQVGRELSKLASQGYPLTQVRQNVKRLWTIDIKALTSDADVPF